MKKERKSAFGSGADPQLEWQERTKRAKSRSLLERDDATVTRLEINLQRCLSVLSVSAGGHPLWSFGSCRSHLHWQDRLRYVQKVFPHHPPCTHVGTSLLKT